MKRFAIVGLSVGLVLFVVWVIRRELHRDERKLHTTGMRVIRQAIEDYASEYGVYPAAHSMRELRARLVRKDGTPLPIRDPFGLPSELSMRDPWFRPWVVEISDQNYSIRSLGADGEPDRDPPRGVLRSEEPADRDMIIVDGLALQHFWAWGGGGDEGGGGSIVSLSRGADAGKIIFDCAVDVMRNGQVLASLPEVPARFQAPAGHYQMRVRLSGSDYFENVIVERGRVRHKRIQIAGASITASEGRELWRGPWFAGLLFLNPRAEVWQGARLIASDCPDCAFSVVPGRYRFVVRDDNRILFDETRELKDGDRWVAMGPKDAPQPDQGLAFDIEPLGPSRYAYPGWTIKGSGVHLQRRTTPYDRSFGFGVPPGKYEVSALLSGQTVRAGMFQSLSKTWSQQNVVMSWGNVHISVVGPIAIHEASVNGWSAVVRDEKKVLARTERFPDVFFLLPGRYTVELLRDGRPRSSKKVAVAAGSEQWIALQE